MFEILQTRIFSVTMWYYFSFMAISIALFGLTIGALWVYLCPKCFNPENMLQDLGLYSLLFSCSIILTFLFYLTIHFTFELDFYTIVSLTLIFVVTAIPFVFSGICICLAFTRCPEQTSKLYAADLLGAAFGCLLIVFSMNIIAAPGNIILIACIVNLAAMIVIFPLQRHSLKIAAGMNTLFLIIMICCYMHTSLFQLNWIKGKKAISVIDEKWNVFSRVTVSPVGAQFPFGWGLSETLPQNTQAKWLLLQIDNLAGSPLTFYQGDIRTVNYLKYDVTNLGYYITPNPEALIIGIGGGRDILSAKLFGAKSITGIEINPAVLDAIRKKFADYTGHLMEDKKLKVVNMDARTFFQHTKIYYDFIQISLIDTWAATAAGAFVLSENSLYTVEAWKQFIQHLSSSGILSISRWYYAKNPVEMYRLTALASESLRKMNIRNPRLHIIIAANVNPNAHSVFKFDGVGTLLLSKSVYTEKQIDTIEKIASHLHFKIILSPRYSNDPVFSVLTQEKTPVKFFKKYPFNISPPTDNQPFFFQYLKWENAFHFKQMNAGMMSFNFKAMSLLIGLLIITVILAFLFIILPLFIKTKIQLSNFPGALLVYFSAIGFGFMFIEISMIQRLTVYLGSPAYSLSVTLFTLLLSAGAGSFLYSVYRRKFLLLFLLLALGGYNFIFPIMLEQLINLSVFPRLMGIMGLIFSLGIFLGVAFPAGLSLLKRHQQEFIPWLWGVNGAASVCASVFATVLSINIGIHHVFLTGCLCYFIAFMSTFSRSLINDPARRKH